VYGGPDGGIVLYRTCDGAQLGAAVDLSGLVSPLIVEGM